MFQAVIYSKEKRVTRSVNGYDETLWMRATGQVLQKWHREVSRYYRFGISKSCSRQFGGGNQKKTAAAAVCMCVRERVYVGNKFKCKENNSVIYRCFFFVSALKYCVASRSTMALPMLGSELDTGFVQMHKRLMLLLVSCSRRRRRCCWR